MTLPTYDQFIEPLLRYLAENPGGVSAVATYEAMAQALRLGEPQRLETTPRLKLGSAVTVAKVGFFLE